MKLSKIIKCFYRKQNGHVFITALIILVLGTLMLTPLLAFMSTGLKTGQAFEEQTDLLYAADAGIENALWQIQNGGAGIIDAIPGIFDGEDYYEGEGIASGLPPYLVDDSGGSLDFYDSEGNLIKFYVEDEEGNKTEIKLYDINGDEISIYDIYDIYSYDSETGYTYFQVYDENGDPLVDENDDPLILYIKGDDENFQGVTGMYDTVFYDLGQQINGYDINVKLTRLNREVYVVSSTSSDDEKSITVKAWLGDRIGDYSSITDHVITTMGFIYTPADKPLNVSHLPIENRPYPNWPPEDWPSAQEMIDYYKSDVKDLLNKHPINDYDETSISGQALIIDANSPTLQNGEDSDTKLLPARYYNYNGRIELSSKSKVTLQLEDTLYITDFGVFIHKDSNISLDLNGNTIFVSNPELQENKYAIDIGSNTIIKGPGAIIAIGNINFQPSFTTSDGPIVIMSVSGYTNFQPGSDFLGCIAGNVRVELDEKAVLNYPEGGFPPLNFPGIFTGGAKMWKILTYEIS